MKPIYFILLLLLPSVVMAETGIVIDAAGYVQYKYDTDTRPTLQPGEYIVLYHDIDSVLKGAKYDGVSFVNPVPPVQVQYEDIILEVKQDPFNPTQTIISGLTAAGTAYFMVRRLKTKGA